MAVTTPKLLWPIPITGSNNSFRFEEPSGGPAFTATLTTSGTNDAYYVSGDATASDLLQNLVTAINAVSPGGLWQARVGTNGTVGLRANNADPADSMKIVWTFNAVTQALGTLLGYDTSVNSPSTAGGTWLDAGSQHQSGWYPERHLVTSLGANRSRIVATSRSLAGSQRTSEFAAFVDRDEMIERLPRGKVFTGEAGYTNEALETFWTAASAVANFRFYPAVTAPATYTRQAIRDKEWLARFVDPSPGGTGGAAANLMFQNFEVYRVTLPMGLYV